MAYSQVSISTIALAMIGEDAIRDFDENNKRARMCDVFFEPSRDYLLSKFDWPFARKFVRLNLLDIPDEELIYGSYAFQLPSDCKTPRDIYPPGSRDNWEILGDRLFCEKEEIGLYYTARIDNPDKFSDTFVHFLALYMALKLAPAITQDKALVKTLMDQIKVAQLEAWESDANIGNDYRAHDEDPNKDTFVNPGIATQLVDESSRA